LPWQPVWASQDWVGPLKHEVDMTTKYRLYDMFYQYVQYDPTTLTFDL